MFISTNNRIINLNNVINIDIKLNFKAGMNRSRDEASRQKTLPHNIIFTLINGKTIEISYNNYEDAKSFFTKLEKFTSALTI